MDLEEIASYWARFHISFSWDYPEGLDLQAVQQAVFHVVGASDARLVHSKLISISYDILIRRALRQIIKILAIIIIYVQLVYLTSAVCTLRSWSISTLGFPLFVACLY
jgi:hypothetical protein